MKIWFVTIGEPVPVGPGFSERLHRTGMMATAFAAAGHDVVWWTSGFDHFKKRHVVKGREEVRLNPNLRINVIPAPGYRRNLSLARLYDHEQIRRRFAVWAGSETAPEQRPDVIISALPTAGLCSACIRMGRAWGVPVLVDLRDMWPDIFVELAPRPLRQAFRAALNPLFAECEDVCRNATALIGITGEFLQWGLNRAGRERRDLDIVVPFVYPETQFPEHELASARQFWDEHGLTGKDGQRIVTFIGTLGRQFHLDAVIACAHRMTARDRNLRFAICGAGDNLEFYRKAAGGNPSIILPGWINASKIRALLERTSVGLDPMVNRFDFLATINNKAVEYLASGVPILSTPDRGALAALLKHSRSGCSSNEDEASLERTLLSMLDNADALAAMKTNASLLYRERFELRTVYRALIRHIEAMRRSGAGMRRSA